MRAVSRRFGLLDVMILVAGIAAGLGLGHNYRVQVQRVRGGFHTSVPEWLVTVGFVLHGLTLAALAIQLRPPRPPLRRASRRAGFATCIAIATAVSFALAWGLAHGLRRGPYLSGIALLSIAHPLLPSIGVASVWIVLMLSGCWRACPEWPDRLGRACGLGWLVAALLAVLFFAG
jgi:hypothetical protein